MMKLDKMVLANAFGLTTAMLWVLCSLIVVVLPDLYLLVMRWWLHGMDVAVIASRQLTFGNFLLGGITLVVSAWVTGWVFGWSWEKVSGKVSG